MFSKKLLGLAVLLVFSGCDKENTPTPKEEWALTEYYANTTSCCFAFDENGNAADSEPSHPVFEALLGLEDGGFHEIVLSLNLSQEFSIFKDGYSIINGDMENDGHHLRLKYHRHCLALKVLDKTENSLIVESMGYTCGITKVKMIFRRQ